MDIEGDMNYGRCDESADSRGRVRSEFEKNRKSCAELIYKTVESLGMIRYPFLPQPPLGRSKHL